MFFYSCRELAAFIGVHESTVSKWLASGMAHKYNGVTYTINSKDVESFLKRGDRRKQFNLARFRTSLARVKKLAS